MLEETDQNKMIESFLLSDKPASKLFYLLENCEK